MLQKRRGPPGQGGPHGIDQRWTAVDRQEENRPYPQPPQLSHSERYSPRRRHLVQHLYRGGPRPILEALLAMEKGERLDDVLADFASIPVSVYRAAGASEMLDDPLHAIEGGRR
jgi:hypothetical protein